MIRAFCSVVIPESSWNSHVWNETLHNGEDGGRTLGADAVWTLKGRGTVHKHNRCVFRSPGVLTFRYGCTVHVGVDVGAGDAEVDVMYISFIISVHYTGYLVPYKDRVQVDNRTTGQRVQY